MTTKSNFIDNKEAKRYELHIDDHIAFVDYIKTPQGITVLTYTSVPAELSGKGVGSTLIEYALQDIQDQQHRVNPLCPFVKSYIQKNPKWEAIHF